MRYIFLSFVFVCLQSADTTEEPWHCGPELKHSPLLPFTYYDHVRRVMQITIVDTNLEGSPISIPLGYLVNIPKSDSCDGNSNSFMQDSWMEVKPFDRNGETIRIIDVDMSKFNEEGCFALCWKESESSTPQLYPNALRIIDQPQPYADKFDGSSFTLFFYMLGFCAGCMFLERCYTSIKTVYIRRSGRDPTGFAQLDDDFDGDMHSDEFQNIELGPPTGPNAKAEPKAMESGI